MIRLPDVPDLAPDNGFRIPKVDPSAAAAPAKSIGALGDSLGSLGSAFHEQALQMQKVDNARVASSARQQWQLDYANLQNDLQKESEPAQIVKKTRDFVQKTRAALSPDLTPVVRIQLESDLDEFGTKAVIDSGALASRLTIKRAGLALGNEVDAAAQNGDRVAFNKAKHSAREAGILLPEQEQQLEHSFNVQSTYTALERDIEKDPVSMSEHLDRPEARDEYSVIGSDGLARLRNSAAQHANRWKADFWNGILNRALDEGPDHQILSKDDLQKLAEEGSITPQQRASYIQTWHSSDHPPFDEHLYNQGYSAISSYNPANDPTGAVIANLRGQIATMPLPKESLAELRNRLDERAKPGPDKPAHRLAADFQKQTTVRFNQGAFGNWFTYQDTDGSPFTADVKVIDAKAYGDALAAQRRFTDSFDAFLRNAPDSIDPLTARKTYDELYSRLVLDYDQPSAKPLVPNAPAPVDFSGKVKPCSGVRGSNLAQAYQLRRLLSRSAVSRSCRRATSTAVLGPQSSAASLIQTTMVALPLEVPPVLADAKASPSRWRSSRPPSQGKTSSGSRRMSRSL